MRLLIVDDDDMNCLGLQKWVRDMKIPGIDHVDVAYSAEEAIAFSHHRQIQILISDIQMAGMNGLKLIETMKALQPRIVAIIITAYASFPYAHRAIDLDVKSFLLKPFSREDLKTALEKAIASMKPEDTLSDTTDPISYAKAYVYDHMDKEVNMASIANTLNLNYSYFSKFFKQETGKTFLAFVLDAKMQEAARLLERKKSIGEISVMLGYGAQQNFSRAFSSYWGCSPNDYRKRLGDGRPRNPIAPKKEG